MSNKTNSLILTWVALTTLMLASCKTSEPPIRVSTPDYARPLGPGEKALVRVPRSQYPDFSRGFEDRERLLEAVEQSIAYMHKPSSGGHFPVEGISHDRVLKSLETFKNDLHGAASAREFAQKVSDRYEVYMSTGCDQQGTVLFTGYCEPIIRASLIETPRFKYPLYRLPDDLIKNMFGTTLGRRKPDGSLVPYYTREEIDKMGLLRGKDLELAWVEHPLDAFIIHVQGSATLQLPEGTKMQIGYAGKNGRPYRSLGQALVRDGKLDTSEVSLDSIRRYFRNKPDDLFPYLYRNESYIFFTEAEGGPFGSIGARVTPYHTIATDKSVFPRAAVTFFTTSLPVRTDQGNINLEPYNGFALDQDTGGAIRSAGRVDVFLGTGKKAEFLAGRTRCEGKLYYLFLREGA